MIRPDLRIDQIYRNTNNWTIADDQFNKMFRYFSDGKGIQNAGGFRWKSSPARSTKIEDAAFVILTTNMAEPEWPDFLDLETGVFTYYGDKGEPGDLLTTKVGGNRFLESVFTKLHVGERREICPILCFQAIKGVNNYMKFLGLAAPGGNGISSLEDLVAVWCIKGGRRFHNYRAIFTILEVDPVPWEWLDDLVSGIRAPESCLCPEAWLDFVRIGSYKALRSMKSNRFRTKSDQLPDNAKDMAILNKILQLSDREGGKRSTIGLSC